MSLTNVIAQICSRKVTHTPLPLRLMVLAAYAKMSVDGYKLTKSFVTDSTQDFLKLYQSNMYDMFTFSYGTYFAETVMTVGFGWMSMYNMPVRKLLEHHGMALFLTFPLIMNPHRFHSFALAMLFRLPPAPPD